MNEVVNMEKLKKMRDEGKLTEEQFEAQTEALYNKSVASADKNRGAKSGVVYILFAWFFGVVGVHNFYAGFWIRGLIQLILTLTSWLFMYIPLIFVALWAFGELLFQNRDAKGLLMTGNRSVILGLRIAAIIWFFLYAYYTYQNNDMVFQDDTITIATED